MEKSSYTQLCELLDGMLHLHAQQPWLHVFTLLAAVCVSALLAPVLQALLRGQLCFSYFCKRAKCLNEKLAVLLHLCSYSELLQVNSQELHCTSNWVSSSTLISLGPHTARTHEAFCAAKMSIGV